jgi:hypothetical protein
MTDQSIPCSDGTIAAAMDGEGGPAVPAGQVFQPRPYLGRKAAAQYITDNYFPCSPKTLAKLACIGGGPEFRKAGRIPIHEPLKRHIMSRPAPFIGLESGAPSSRYNFFLFLDHAGHS